ncbi:MAG: tetratricopeptide repeat protein [Gemmataceae bacterium]|nr:tetratricopeptide repeat protein [Gemmataceae bacterium]MDW8267060.1 tetratricopeptide repeat protein [Gemmataceae bacterium]
MRVSLTMIVRNEEANLVDCLRSVAGLVDEIVVVDTGSSDRTREVAASFGAAVWEFPWCDDFAAARNESLRRATGDWVFWMDADDRLDADNRDRFRRLRGELVAGTAYVMKCVSPISGGDAAEQNHVRLFQKRPGLTWEFRVHEQILPGLRRLGDRIQLTDVIITHLGYEGGGRSPEKLERNLRLLLRDLDDHPEHPFVLDNLGRTCFALGRLPEAIAYLRRALRVHPDPATAVEIVGFLLRAHRALGELPAAQALCQAARQRFPASAELQLQEGILALEAGNLSRAEVCLRSLAADAGPGRTPGQRETAWLYWARLERRRGRFAEAEAWLRSLVSVRPEWSDAWMELADLWLGLGRPAELETAARQLESSPRTLPLAFVLRARLHLQRGDWAAARQLASDAIALAPRALLPRIVLSHALLLEGKDFAAAEQALRDILAIDPLNAAARHNLAELLKPLSPSDPGTVSHAP